MNLSLIAIDTPCSSEAQDFTEDFQICSQVQIPKLIIWVSLEELKLGQKVLVR